MSYEKEELLSGQGEPTEVALSGQCDLLEQEDLLGQVNLSIQGELTEDSTVLKADPDALLCVKSNGGQNADGDFQGVIRLNNLHGLSPMGKIQLATIKKVYKRRSRWLCQQFGFPSKCKRQDNFLNLTEEEIQEKYEKFIKGETVAKCTLTRKTLDVSKWPLTAFRSTIWGHLNADEEDGSEVPVKNFDKWFSHDLLYNSRFVGEEYWKQEFPRGKYIVPNQGKGWSFQTRGGGKGKVYGLEFMTQPKLQLYY